MSLNLETLQRLTLCKSPIVGLPRPGQYAFALKRTVLATLIEGLPDSAKVELNGRLEITEERRKYILEDCLPMKTQPNGMVWTSAIQARKKACGGLKKRVAAKAPPSDREALVRELKRLDNIIMQYTTDWWKKNYKYVGMNYLEDDLLQRQREVVKYEQAGVPEALDLALMTQGPTAKEAEPGFIEENERFAKLYDSLT